MTSTMTSITRSLPFLCSFRGASAMLCLTHSPLALRRQPASMNAKLATQHKPEPVNFDYTTRDAVMYAIGIGCKTKDDIRYLYEGAEGFMPLPTFIVASGIDLEIPRILHGEQYIEMYEPLPAEGSIRTETRVLDIIDKGSGALIYTEITAYDKQSGAKLGIHRFTMFQFCAGNFGGPRSSSYDKKGAEIPKRPADKIISETTSEDQAAIYRLGSGDFNPLHIDPNQAQISGFNRPILHGLCTMGFATRHILKTYANNDARLFKAIKVRETGKTVISNGYVILHKKND